MPATYENIATTTLGSSQANIDFTNIPGTFTDLVVIATLKRAAAGALDANIRVGNNSFDTGSNYSTTLLYGTGSAAGSTRFANQTSILADYYGSVNDTNEHIAIYQFMNYSNTTTNKTVIIRANRASSGVDAIVGLWRSTSAINQIRITLDLGGAQLMASGSTITLYGIKAA